MVGNTGVQATSVGIWDSSGPSHREHLLGQSVREHVQTMSQAPTLRFEQADLETFAAEILRGAGLASPHREVVASALVRADLRGVDSHGVARLEPYVAHLEAGGFNPDPAIELTERSESSLAVDADNGPGQPAGKATMERLISMAKQSGVAVGVVKNSNHFGTAAYYTEMAASEDCIGVAMTNVPAEVIPFGGREPYLGTNPIAVSIPTDADFPITLDMATSIVAMGKVSHVAAETDESIPEEWGVDENGEPTTDPHELRALRPLGGAKGYCLAVIVDLLTGVLSDANPSIDVGSLYDDFDEPMGLGHFYLAIDVATLRDVDAFKADVGQFAAGLKAIQPEEGVSEVMLPGEIESRTRLSNEERGVPVNRPVFEKLATIAAEYGVEPPAAVQ